jgi:hypothetical protein
LRDCPAVHCWQGTSKVLGNSKLEGTLHLFP